MTADSHSWLYVTSERCTSWGKDNTYTRNSETFLKEWGVQRVLCTVCAWYTRDGWLPEPIIGGSRQEPRSHDRLTAHGSIRLAWICQVGRRMDCMGQHIRHLKMDWGHLEHLDSIRVLHLFREMAQFGHALWCVHTSWLSLRLIMA